MEKAAGAHRVPAVIVFRIQINRIMGQNDIMWLKSIWSEDIMKKKGRNPEDILNQIENNKIDEAAESYFQKYYELIGKCRSRLLNNEISIIDNKAIYDIEVIRKEISQKKIVELLDKLHEDEDIRNSHINIRQISHNNVADDGFSLYYPHLVGITSKQLIVQAKLMVADYLKKIQSKRGDKI